MLGYGYVSEYQLAVVCNLGRAEPRGLVEKMEIAMTIIKKPPVKHGFHINRTVERSGASSEIHRFAAKAYKKTDGATPALRATYAAYIDNQKKRA
jgi:hypothetical protein